MRRFVIDTLLKGLSLVLPLALALWVIGWLIVSTESAAHTVIRILFPAGWYVPGLGLLLATTGIFLVGLLMRPWITRTLMQLTEKALRRIPVFGSVYAPIKDLTDLIGGDLQHQLGRPVMIRIPNTEMDTLGFVTRESGQGLPEGIVPDGHLVVYVQWSSQIGGYCFIVPQEAVRAVPMSVEEGVRWALTAGLSGPQRSTSPRAEPSTARPRSDDP
jgi:uncharacterized membrane protein